MFVSIVGDSISMYEGYSPNGYKVFYNRTMQIANGLNSVYDTWWAKVDQWLHAYLCVNNSYSGRCMVQILSGYGGIDQSTL